MMAKDHSRLSWLACKAAVDCADGFFLETADLPEGIKAVATVEATHGVEQGIREMAAANGIADRLHLAGLVALASLAFRKRLSTLALVGKGGVA